MARTKLNQRSADRVAVPMDATGGRTPPSKVSMALLVMSIITALWAAAMLTPYGRIAYYFVFIYSEFYMGVITLVSLSITRRCCSIVFVQRCTTRAVTAIMPVVRCADCRSTR